MDGTRGHLRFLRREVVPPDVEGSHLASHHPQSRSSCRITRHEPLGKGGTLIFLNFDSGLGFTKLLTKIRKIFSNFGPYKLPIFYE